MTWEETVVVHLPLKLIWIKKDALFNPPSHSSSPDRLMWEHRFVTLGLPEIKNRMIILFVEHETHKRSWQVEDERETERKLKSKKHFPSSSVSVFYDWPWAFASANRLRKWRGIQFSVSSLLVIKSRVGCAHVMDQSHVFMPFFNSSALGFKSLWYNLFALLLPLWPHCPSSHPRSRNQIKSITRGFMDNWMRKFLVWITGDQLLNRPQGSIPFSWSASVPSVTLKAESIDLFELLSSTISYSSWLVLISVNVCLIIEL